MTARLRALIVFIALNRPAPHTDAAEKGIPDQNNVIGGRIKTGEPPTSMPAGPTVWQTFKDTNEIFLPRGVKPVPFDASPVVPVPCRKHVVRGRTGTCCT